jgi:TupA-like ATPgrasp
VLRSGPRDILRSQVYNLPVGLKRRVLFAYNVRQLPHFRNPRTFNEKMNWRILYDRRPLLEWPCDKLAAKDSVQEMALADLYVPRTIWSGSDIHDLQTAELPDHWVLKPNHRSGLVHFGSGSPDIRELSVITATWLDNFHSTNLGEWGYSTARPMLLVEELLGEPGMPPPDYKFYAFGGEVACAEMHVNRFNGHAMRMYTPDWIPLDVYCPGFPVAPATPAPSNLGKMLSIASQLSKPFDFMRVDLYDLNDAIAFGELTAYSSGGLDRFIPTSFDAELGEKWKLPEL